MDGAAGRDTLVGGTGNDTLIVDYSGDVIIEQPGEGTDIANSRLSWTLGDNIEQLYLRTSASINGTGNAGANLLIGNSGANGLSGLAGDDKAEGRGGDDTLAGGTGTDLLTGNAGEDVFVFRVGDGADTVTNILAGSSAERLETHGFGRFTLETTSGGTLVRFSASDAVLLRGVSANALASTDIVLKDVPVQQNRPIGPLTDADAAANQLPENASAGASVGLSVQASDPDPDST